jgi:predicted nucleotidyltransferase
MKYNILQNFKSFIGVYLTDLEMKEDIEVSGSLEEAYSSNLT